MAKLSPIYNWAEFINGIPASGAKVFTYSAGSSTKLTTYTDSGGLTPQSNPIILNARGEPASPIWLTEGQSYKFVFTASTDTDPPTSPIRTIDNITGVGDNSVSLDQWIDSGVTPTYVSAAQFTLAGDQTTAFHVGRRIKATVTAGTVYATITAASFAALTTVTVIFEDSGALDSGLSSVQLGILTRTNDSIPRGFSLGKEIDVAAAATTDIGAVASDNVRITGSATISSFGTANAGIVRSGRFSGACTLTYNAASMIISGGATVFTAAGDRFDAVSLGSGNWIVTVFPISATIQRGYIAGLTMSTAGSSATMTIAAGQAADSANAILMGLSSSIGKTTSAWSVGTGNGGLDTGVIANSTWYHFYLIRRPDTGVVDVVFSTSSSAPTLPASYTQYRRIGSGLTNGSAQWTSFIQDGDMFQWLSPPLDVNATNPGTSAVSRTLSTPLGVNVISLMNVNLVIGGTGSAVYLSDLATTDLTPSITAAPLSTISVNVTNAAQSIQAQIRTNTSSQIRSRASFSDASVILRIATYGWMDTRGRNA